VVPMAVVTAFKRAFFTAVVYTTAIIGLLAYESRSIPERFD